MCEMTEGEVLPKAIMNEKSTAKSDPRGGGDCKEEATMCEKAVKERAHMREYCEEEDTMCEKTCARRLPGGWSEKTAKRAEQEDCEKWSRPRVDVGGRASKKRAHVRGDRARAKVAKR